MSQPSASGQLEGGAAVLRDPLVHELLSARLVGVLATFDRARRIHAVPMWFAAEESAVMLATGSRSRKVRNLQRDGRATLVIHDSRPGFEVCGVSISGTIDVIAGDDARPLVDRVHRRYVAESADAHPDVHAFLSSDDVALRFRPESAFTWDERGSGASAALRERGGAFPLESTGPRR